LKTFYCRFIAGEVVVVQIHQTPRAILWEKTKHFFADELRSPSEKSECFEATVFFYDWRHAEIDEHCLVEGFAEHHVARVDIHMHYLVLVELDEARKQRLGVLKRADCQGIALFHQELDWIAVDDNVEARDCGHRWADSQARGDLADAVLFKGLRKHFPFFTQIHLKIKRHDLHSQDLSEIIPEKQFPEVAFGWRLRFEERVLMLAAEYFQGDGKTADEDLDQNYLEIVELFDNFEGEILVCVWSVCHSTAGKVRMRLETLRWCFQHFWMIVLKMLRGMDHFLFLLDYLFPNFRPVLLCFMILANLPAH
jgi:hypothetical protein